jgi:hypothetical protein
MELEDPLLYIQKPTKDPTISQFNPYHPLCSLFLSGLIGLMLLISAIVNVERSLKEADPGDAAHFPEFSLF